ncbi:unnamed protein product [Adineta steineri]|uniref:Biotin-protein ligase N-terminal domain-containing protein n=1 Tax=Adineta steineri TaxID=433720 RepID=A0A815M3H6_9BILA|nr:unnamed protein product [Adineta steineri]CAF1415054.1 unnamed protein product [Adineta steineri]
MNTRILLSFFLTLTLYQQITCARPIALIYRGPAACKGCSESIATLLKDKYKIVYAGPREKVDVNADTLSTAKLYVQPGGGDLDEIWPHVRQYASPIRKYIKNGGRYLGICLGGYLAGTEPGFDLLPGKGQTDQYITSKGAVVTSEIDTVVPLLWRGKLRHVYFQDGTRFDLDRTAAPTEILATYTNGKIAAAVQDLGKGRIGMVGPHPEADKEWYAMYKLKNPDGMMSFDLFYDLVETLMA